MYKDDVQNLCLTCVTAILTLSIGGYFYQPNLLLKVNGSALERNGPKNSNRISEKVHTFTTVKFAFGHTSYHRENIASFSSPVHFDLETRELYYGVKNFIFSFY